MVSHDALILFIRERVAQRTGSPLDSVLPSSLLLDLGLESLDAVLLCGEIEDTFGIEVVPADIFEAESILDFSNSILSRLGTK